MAEIITIEEYKAAELIKSPESDVQITPIVAGVNSFLSNLLGLDNTSERVYKDTYAFQIFLDTTASAKDILVLDAEGEVLTGLVGTKGSYTLTNEYTGEVFLTYPPSLDTSTGFPDELKMAAIYLVRHYRKDEYKTNASGGGQSVSYVTLSSNIPKHVLALISPYRPL